MENDNKNNDEKKLEDYYHFDSNSNQQNGEETSYFKEVKNLIPQVDKAAKKIDEIRNELKKKIKELLKELEGKQGETTKKDSEKGSDFAAEDLAFCREAVAASGGAKEHILSGKRELEDILSSGVERSYHVVTDVALAPLPSDRAKNLGNEKGVNGNGNDEPASGEDNSQNPSENREMGMLTPGQLAALRGTSGKGNAAKVSEKSADGQEKVNPNDDSAGKPITPRNIDFSQGITKPKGHGY